MRRDRIASLKVLGIVCLMVGGAGIGHAVGETYSDMLCVTIAAPVTDCECPLGPSHND